MFLTQPPAPDPKNEAAAYGLGRHASAAAGRLRTASLCTVSQPMTWRRRGRIPAVLERPPKPPPPEAQEARRKRERRERSVRYRQRAKAGELVVSVKINFWVIDQLVADGCLPGGDEQDRGETARAWEAGLEHWCRYD